MVASGVIGVQIHGAFESGFFFREFIRQTEE
jgi:hypothetical protein